MDRMEGIIVVVNKNGICPIWGVNCTLSSSYDTPHIWRVEYSLRAGGHYEINHEARYEARDLDDDQKARLTSILVEQRMRGVDVPRLTATDVQRAKDRQPLPVHDRAVRLLGFLVRSSSNQVGQSLHISERRPDLFYPALAWSESVKEEELDYLSDYLKHQGWIAKVGYAGCNFDAKVEVPGYSRVEEMETNPDSSQCFVAMWFDDSMNEVYRNGIGPAIKAAGFSPLRIDREDFVGKIDDKIIAEIRRSRFIVADFTHGDGGARGGVYYEAGFAEGHGLDVIFTCRNDLIDKVHFDTRQFNHIVWNDPDDLRERLENRIRRVIGEGPNANR